MAADHVDVLIVGAGLSGIGAAVHLGRECPGKTYAVLEARGAIGGTWDLFRYPGIRSDSDMYTLGYSFKPWTDPKAIADGDSIRAYVRQTAREYDVERHIRFHHRAVRAEWDSATARWTVHARRDDTGEDVTITCGFLFTNSGYYRYDSGYTPRFPGVERYAGTLVHPQHWPDDLDYTGKRVVVIGSGATAVTLVPAMAERAAHVTMLQRSPTYVIALPSRDPFADAARRWLPPKAAYTVARWKNVALGVAQLPAQPACPRRGEAVPAPGREGPAARRVRRRAALLAPVRPVGPAPVRGAGRRPVHRAARGTRVGGHRHHRHVHRARAPARLRRGAARRHRGHRHRPEPARARRHDPGGRRRRRRPRLDGGLQGHDAVRRAELRHDDRLHERFLDAQGRPRRHVRLPAAAPPRRDRPADRHAARPGHRRPGADHRPAVRLRAARRRPAAQAGAARAVAAAPELPPRRTPDAARPAHRRRTLRPRRRTRRRHLGRI
ncbi:monooxygenase, flavin-binding [Micromonospora sp. M42]|nr:monooxygenase, flavin-binding [Micromonospora sp. M42]